MVKYQLPSDLSRDQFSGLLTDLYYLLAANGLDPVFNMVVGDRDEVCDDGTIRGIFQLIVSQAQRRSSQKRLQSFNAQRLPIP